MARWQYQALTEPVPPKSTFPTWLPSFPDRILTGAILTAAIAAGSCFFTEQHHVIPQFAPLETTYPDQISTPISRRPHLDKAMFGAFDVEAEVAKPDEWYVSADNPVLGLFRRPYLDKAMFGAFDVEVEIVKPDQWYPAYPDQLIRKLELSVQDISVGPILVGPEVVTCDKWLGYYPSQIDRKPEPIREQLAYTPYTPLTADQWQPIYPSRLDPAGRPFWAGVSVIDPYPISLITIGPDKWGPIYPSLLLPSPRIVEVGQSVIDPYYHEIVVPPPTVSSWCPTYPSLLIPQRKVFWSGTFVIPPRPIALISLGPDRWQPTYPHRIERAKRFYWQGEFAYNTYFVPEVIPVSRWLPNYPIRLDRVSRPFWAGITIIDPYPIPVVIVPPTVSDTVVHLHSLITEEAVLESPASEELILLSRIDIT